MRGSRIVTRVAIWDRERFVRFKSLEDLALDVVGRTVARVSVEEHMANYQAARALLGKGKSSAKKGANKSAVKNGAQGMSDMAGKAAR